MQKKCFISLDKYTTVVVANGEMPTHPLAMDALKNAQNIVCCDGAFHSLRKLGILPTVIVGDGDSLSQEDIRNFAHLYVPDKSTEYNDLTKAFHICRKNCWKEVVVLGATGLREDHALANLSILMNLEEGFHVVAVSNYGVFTPIARTTIFDSFEGQPVSVFSFTPETEITFKGLQYPVQNRQFKHFWEGSLNVSLGEYFTVSFDDGKLLVYQAFKNQI